MEKEQTIEKQEEQKVDKMEFSDRPKYIMLEKTKALYTMLHSYLELFPKTEKFTLRQKIEDTIRRELVHYVLSLSYATYFLAIIVGIVLGIIFPINIFTNQIYQYVGFGFVILGTMLIYWAQSTSYRGWWKATIR